MVMLREIEDESGITPHALKNLPVLDDRLSFFYREFLQLARERTYSESGHPLKLRLGMFLDYCRFHSIDNAEARWMWNTVALLDDVWHDEVSKKSRSDAQTKSQKAE